MTPFVYFTIKNNKSLIIVLIVLMKLYNTIIEPIKVIIVQ